VEYIFLSSLRSSDGLKMGKLQKGDKGCIQKLNLFLWRCEESFRFIRQGHTVFFLVKKLTPLLLKNPDLSSPPYFSFRKAFENSGESPDYFFLTKFLFKVMIENI